MTVTGYTKAQMDTLLAGISISSPGIVYFDDLSGTTDDQKLTTMNTMTASYGDGQTGDSIQPAILFGARDYNFSATHLVMNSGMTLVGYKRSPAHGTRVQTRFNWTGTGAFLTYPGTQTDQGYPSDGSPRDMYFSGILFNGQSGKDFITKKTPLVDSSVGVTMWYSSFMDCAWSNWNTIHWGYVDGITYGGQLDISQITTTAFYLSGAESVLFGDAVYSQADTTTDTGAPFIRSRLQKSLIGWCLFTGRQSTSGLSIEGGANLQVRGFNVDAQNSDPMYGAGITISGGDGIHITDLSVKGVMTAPSSSTQGGASGNKGYIHITGGTQIQIDGVHFRREGTNLPATSTPLVYAAAGVGAGQVKFGMNGWSGYSGAGAVVAQSASGTIWALSDPGLTVNSGV